MGGFNYNDQILNYYDGGADQAGAIGPDYGISFDSGALAMANYPFTDARNEPGGGNWLWINDDSLFPYGTSFMNVEGGFKGTFSLYYDEYQSYYGVGPSMISLYSGTNGGGKLLASLSLLPTFTTPPYPYVVFWTPVELAFNGVARSVEFQTEGNFTAFADLQLDTVHKTGASVPDHTGPGTLLLAALGLVGMGIVLRKHEKASVLS